MWSHHSHSGQFCRHAQGQLSQVLQTACQKGFSTFGLSEHMPRFRTQDLYPEEQDMTYQDLSDVFDAYIRTAKRLRAEYADRMTVLIGVETDVVHSGSIQDLQSVLETYSKDLDYVVGSVHHVRGIPIDFDQPTFQTCLDSFAGDWQAYFQAYFDTQYELLQAVHPEVVGHFDLCRLYDSKQTFDDATWAKIKRNVRYVVAYGGLFELNAAAFRKGWATAYPGQDILQLILSLNGKICISDDSHGPHAVALHYQDAFKYLEDMNVDTLYYLEPSSTQPEEVRGRRKTVAREVLDWRAVCQDFRLRLQENR